MKIKFSISSNINFYKVTFPVIVDSLLSCGINRDDIYFFIGGFNKYLKLETEINTFFVDHNSFDFTGLVSIVDLDLESDYWFLIHDTCFVGNNFLNKLKSHTHDTETIRLYSGMSMNMGSYRQDYLNKIKTDILSYKNVNFDSASLQNYKSRLVLSEDVFFNKSQCKPYTSNQRFEGPIDFYKNGVMRMVEHYDDLDFHKVKANWFPKPHYELSL